MTRHHDLPDADGVVWQVIEEPAEMWGEPEEDGYYEDSELTITVDWGDRPRGTLSSGLTVLEPAAKTRNVDLYLVDLGSYVGQLELKLQDAEGDTLRTHDAPVHRRKLASDDDLREMERYWAMNRVPVDASSARRVYRRGGAQAGESNTVQSGAMMSDLLKPLVTASRGIERKPKRGVEVTTQRTPARAIKRPQISPILSTLKGDRWVKTTRPKWTEDPGARDLAAHDARQLLQHIRRLRELIQEEGERLDPHLDKVFRELGAHLRKIAAKGEPNERPRPRQAILQDSRYRLLHRASLLTRRAPDPNDDSLRTFQLPTHELYEEWCAWAITKTLAPEERLPDLRAELGHFREERVLELTETPEEITLTVQYEMSLLGRKHRPDLVLHVESPNHVIVLDVKYRGTGRGLTSVPSDAVAELHRYRDVYVLRHPESEHKTVWAAVLHPAPGWTDGDWERESDFDGAVNPSYRIGAVGLSPSLLEPVEEYFGELLGSIRPP